MAAWAASANPAGAWGFAGHRLVNDAAIDTLPEPLRAALGAHRDFLVEHSVDPDLWRAAGAVGEEPNHFLDLDAFGAPPFASIPRDEQQHLAAHGAAAAERGRVPWRVAEEYRALVEAFEGRETPAILEHAAVLGHYVADAHVPLHAALNYDGQLSGQAGVHSRWESRMVERFAEQVAARLSPAPAVRLGQGPVETTFGILLASFEEVPGLLDSDRACAGDTDYLETPEDDRYDDAYYSRLYAREAARLERRLSRAASAVGSFWLSAWEQAGRPDLDPSERLATVRGRTRLALMSLDGASAPVIEDAVARGVMPQLAALRAAGATGRGLPPLPAKTASGHAALYTGAWSPANGIGGNSTPVAGAPLVEWTNGYSSTPLRAEPLWVTAARQGLRATVVSSTQAYPFEPYGREARFGGRYGYSLTLFDGYQNFEAREAVLTAEQLPRAEPGGWPEAAPGGAEARQVVLQVAGHQVDGLLFDDPDDPTAGLDTLLLTLDKDAAHGIRLKPEPVREDAGGFRGLTLPGHSGTTVVYFRLFELAADGSRILLLHTAPHSILASRPGLDQHTAGLGGFVGNGVSASYAAGRLGAPVWQGGDGTAERRYLESAALVARQFGRLNALAIARTRWDVLVTYLPFPDEFEHLWLGFLDPGLDGYDATVAARLRPFLDAGLRIIDGSLGELREALGPDVVLAVSGDHGQIATRREFRPNVALAAAGLLGIGRDGRIDLTRTRAAYFPGNSGFVMVNRAARPEGIVAPADEAQVLAEASAALLAARDPETGARLVERLLRPGHAPGLPDFGGPSGGDVYLSIAPGYSVSADVSGALAGPRIPGGEHLLDPQRPEMHVAFAVAGPGVEPGASLGEIRQVDIAPTLCALVGLDPPAQATGVVLNAAFEHPAREPRGRALGRAHR